jgi:hypothetical protein
LVGGTVQLRGGVRTAFTVHGVRHHAYGVG